MELPSTRRCERARPSAALGFELVNLLCDGVPLGEVRYGCGDTDDLILGKVDRKPVERFVVVQKVASATPISLVPMARECLDALVLYGAAGPA